MFSLPHTPSIIEPSISTHEIFFLAFALPILSLIPLEGRGREGPAESYLPISTHHKMLDLELEEIVGSAGWEKDIGLERISVEKVRRSKKELYELESQRGKYSCMEKVV